MHSQTPRTRSRPNFRVVSLFSFSGVFAIVVGFLSIIGTGGIALVRGIFLFVLGIVLVTSAVTLVIPRRRRRPGS